MYLPPKDKRIGILSFDLDGYKSEDIGMILDEDFDIAQYFPKNLVKTNTKIGLQKKDAEKCIAILSSEKGNKMFHVPHHHSLVISLHQRGKRSYQNCQL